MEKTTSQIKLTNSYAEHLINKINQIANAVPFSTIVAEKIFK